MKVQCNLKIEYEVIERFKKIATLDKFEMSKCVEGWMKQYIAKWDTTHIVGIEQKPKPNILCSCGAEYGVVLERCPQCGLKR